MVTRTCVVQRTRDGSAGSHVDVRVADVRAAADGALTLGATIVDDGPGLVVRRSPGGLPFCVVHHHGGSTRPVPVVTGGTTLTRIDQICTDAAPERFDAERTFWSAVTGWADPRRSEAGAHSAPTARPDAGCFCSGGAPTPRANPRRVNSLSRATR